MNPSLAGRINIQMLRHSQVLDSWMKCLVFSQAFYILLCQPQLPRALSPGGSPAAL